ncbi:MAG: 3-isopropylmalate dehydratase small subunit [Candidatus Rokubacteria bacterium]|nr:3-isopropylmalate dehydratase small subunit [Candidatus Rokubacteria bacterium]
MTGRVHRFGDNVDTDMIMPARYLGHSRAEQSRHAMEGVDSDFTAKVQPGDVIVAGRNFGCGSARPAHRPLQDAGVSCVIAASFANLFMRNAVNEGLPILRCPEAARELREGDLVEVDHEGGIIRCPATGRVYQAEMFPEFIRQIIRSGGLIPYAREKVKQRVQEREEK